MPAYRASRPNKIRDPAMRRYLSENPLAHGGDFFKKSGGRKRRYISEAGSMNLTLRGTQADRKSTRLNSSHLKLSRMPSSA